MIEFHNICKSFFGVKVLNDVSFHVTPGMTVGLVGENGAGKSTLMNILGGNLRADSGAMHLQGRPYAPRSPRDARLASVAFIHQELNLFANLSIAENIFLDDFPRRFAWVPMIDRRAILQRTALLLRELGLSYSPDTRIEQLSAGERQLVEIAKALAFDARLIILDEPTTSLTVRETDRLFALLASLRNRGISMLYISHNLGDVMKLCDEIVVLRDGAVAANKPASQLTLERMVSLMVGREITQLFPQRGCPPQDSVALDVRAINQPGIARNITFQVRHGEILGVSGLMGSGRSEMARILFGLEPCASGEIRLNGSLLNGLTPRERIQRGLGFVTEDRRTEGLCMDAPIADNIALVALPHFVRSWFRFVNRTDVQAAIGRIRKSVELTALARDDQAAKTLSGGNQQKVVIAKWLLNEPKVLILDEPTRGIDVGAKYELYKLINHLAAQGAGVLLISSEVEELMGLCDRILVMRRGEISDTVSPRASGREHILRAALHDGALS